jgi:hypothetical protein
MTCIVGLVDKNKVYIGGDSAGISNSDLRIITHPKVFILNKNTPKMIFGSINSFRIMQALQYSLKIPIQTTETTDHEYLCTKFVDALRNCFVQSGCATETSEGEEEGGTFVLGYKGKLYKIEQNYQVLHYEQPYITCGGGEDLALGSLFTTEKLNWPPKKRIKEALKASAKFNTNVAPPFTILSIKKDD